MNSTKDRTWIVDGDPLIVDDEATLAQAVGEVVTILSRVGGAVIIAADREQVAPDMWATTRFIFRWSSYVPGKRKEPVVEQDAADA